MRSPIEPVDRDCNVDFFVASRGGPPAGRATRVNVEDLLIMACELPRDEIGDHGRYEVSRRGRLLAVDLHDCSAGLSFVFGEVNRADLNPVERNGEVRRLALDTGWGLLSPTYCVTFGPDYPDLIASIAIDGAPNVRRLAQYLTRRACPGRPFRLERLQDLDVSDALARMRAISSFHLKIDPSQVPIVQGHWDSLDARLEADASLYAEQAFFDVRITPHGGSRIRAVQLIMEPVRSLLNVAPFLARGSEFRLRGPLDDTAARIVVLDLLAQKLSAPVSVERETPEGSALHKWSAYEALRVARQALGSSIDDAMAARQVSDAF